MHVFQTLTRGLLVAALATIGTPHFRAAEPGPRTPGPQADGSVILPNQWSLRPAGRQVGVGDFPASIAMHPNGRHAVVLHCPRPGGPCRPGVWHVWLRVADLAWHPDLHRDERR